MKGQSRFGRAEREGNQGWWKRKKKGKKRDKRNDIVIEEGILL